MLLQNPAGDFSRWNVDPPGLPRPPGPAVLASPDVDG